MKLSIQDMTLISLFTALTIAAAVSLRFLSPMFVPYSLLPFVAILAGSLLGGRRAALSMVIYILLGLVGIPVFQKAPFGGLTYVFQPTFGFIIGFIGAAYFSGRILAVCKKTSLLNYLIAAIVGLAVIYLVGLPYLYLILNFYLGKAVPVMGVLKMGFFPFILIDLGKAVAAALLARPVARQVGIAIPTER